MPQPNRVRNIKTGKWIDLPDSPDDMIWHPGLRRYFPCSAVKASAEKRMAAYDARPTRERYILAYYGGSAFKPARKGFNDRKLDNHTPNETDFAIISLAEELGL